MESSNLVGYIVEPTPQWLIIKITVPDTTSAVSHPPNFRQIIRWWLSPPCCQFIQLLQRTLSRSPISDQETAKLKSIGLRG